LANISRSRKISLVALFTALAVILNFLISVPAPYADFLLYEVWEVPILISLLILGFWGGTTVAVLNTLVLEIVKPGALPTGPVYNLVAELAMFVGVVVAVRAGRRLRWKSLLTVVTATALGVATRTAVMTVVNGVVLPMPYPLGFGSFGVTQAQVPALLVLIGVFNATVALYTIPFAFSIGRALSSRYRLPMVTQAISTG
jgi:riboflavin transporter FmnP